MSRCFPFPPPGYEREHRPEDLTLLKEVKHKEKKQKKDKKDKERRTDKEKKEKDENGEKKKDKKDRKGKHKDKKEKHRDKKKDKEDRGKDKEKSSISEEPTVAGKLEERSEEELQPKGHNKDSSAADGGKFSTFLQGPKGGKPSQSCLPSQATKDAKFVQELDRRIGDNDKGRGSQLPERIASMDKRDQEAAAGTALRNPLQVWAEEKGNDKDKRVHIKKMDTQRLDGEFSGKAMAQNLIRAAKSQNEGTRPVEEQNNWTLEDKEKRKETGDDKQGDKQKERDKKSHGKDKDKKKEKKKEKVKLKIENKKSEHEKSKNAGTNALILATSNKSTNLLKDVDSAALNEGNVRKRKDMNANGFLHESEIRPNEVQSLALHQSTENGRKLEASHNSSKSSFDKQAAPNNVRLDHHVWLHNGIIDTQKPSPSKPHFSGTNMVSVQNLGGPRTMHPDFRNANEALTVRKVKDHVAEEAPRRPPHPDSKYLSQVLTVPKVVDWSEYDDQEWLFNKEDPPKKPKVELSGVKEPPHVWCQAVHIESADVYALPYVIPY